MMKQLLYLAIFLLISSDTVLAIDPKYTVLSDEFTANYFWGVGNPLSNKRRVSCPEYHSDDIKKIKEEGRSKSIGCARTKEIIYSSNYGFLFTVYQSEGEDKRFGWTDVSYCNDRKLCSGISDFGGGRNEMRIIDQKHNKYISVTADSLLPDWNCFMKQCGSISLHSHLTSTRYPYLIIKKFTGGASCCVSFLFYLKEDIELDPFVIDYSKYDVLEVTDDLQTYYPGWFKHFSEETRTAKQLNYIDDVIEEHFKAHL